MQGALEERRADALTNRLVQTANPSGGWPYYAGKKSRIEPTCWALLALQGVWTGGIDDWNRFAANHLRFLTTSQRPSGLLTDDPQVPANLVANGLAACTLSQLFPETKSTVLPALAQRIVALKGVKLDELDARQNNSLQAWPWYPDTFSWVEPTAWCVLALKKLQRTAAVDGMAKRLTEAERMMENRCCESGGWNYGNASVLGQDLRPHLPPTATALMAFRDRADRPFVTRSIDFLDGMRLTEASGLALGLTALCLRLYGRKSTDVEAHLATVSVQTETIGNVHAMGVALYALTADRHHAQAFRVVE